MGRSFTLKEQFPRLYLCSVHKEAMVAHLGGWEDDIWKWNFTWRRHLYQWEKEDVCNMFQIFLKQNIIDEQGDLSCVFCSDLLKLHKFLDYSTKA